MTEVSPIAAPPSFGLEVSDPARPAGMGLLLGAAEQRTKERHCLREERRWKRERKAGALPAGRQAEPW